MAYRAPAFGAFLATFALSLPAFAREIDYRAPESCPSRDAVVASLDARATNGRDVTISIRHEPSRGYRGEIVLGDQKDADASVTRTVEARSCAAVVDALVLVAALDRSPNATAPVDAREEAASTQTTTKEPAAEPASTTGPTTPTTLDDDRRLSHEPRRAQKSRISSAFGLGIGMTSFVRHDMVSVASGFGDIEPVSRTSIRWFTPALRLTVSRTANLNVETSPIGSSFALTSAAIDLCNVAGEGFEFLQPYVSGAFCARTEGGMISASSGDGGSAVRGWLTVGMAARTRVYFNKGGDIRPFAEIASSFTFPLTYTRFRVFDDVIATDSTVLSIGLVGGVAFR